MVFNGYIEIWEDLYEKQFKNKVEMLPKSFYKHVVEKVTGNKGNNSNNQTNINNNNKPKHR